MDTFLIAVTLCICMAILLWLALDEVFSRPEMSAAYRPYRSGTDWCWWRWTIVDSEYIKRLFVLKSPMNSICVHWINKPDPEPYDHDHPVDFFSIVLSGGYAERRNGVIRWRRRWNFIRASAEDQHTIVEVLPNTVTLCFMGRKTRDWGFHTPGGWVMWKDYYAAQRAAKLAA